MSVFVCNAATAQDTDALVDQLSRVNVRGSDLGVAFKPSSFAWYGQYNCMLKYRLDHHAPPTPPFTPPFTVAQTHMNRGNEVEAELANQLQQNGERDGLGALIRCNVGDWQALNIVDLLRRTLQEQMAEKISAKVLLYQSCLEPKHLDPGAIQDLFHQLPRTEALEVIKRVEFHRMFPDLLRVEYVLPKPGECAGAYFLLTVIDIKSSSKMKGGHQMQVAFYHKMLLPLAARVGRELGVEFRVNGTGEIWIPYHLADPQCMEEDEVSKRLKHRVEKFLVSSIDPLLYGFFTKAMPNIVSYSGKEENAYDNIRWSVQGSCYGCPHLLRCKERALRENRVQCLPDIEEADWDWLPPSGMLADLEESAKAQQQVPRFRVLTYGRIRIQALVSKKALPLLAEPPSQQSAVPSSGRTTSLLPPSWDVSIGCYLVLHPSTKEFVVGGIYVFGEADIFVTKSAETFVATLAAKLACVLGRLVRVFVWDESHRNALLKVCNKDPQWQYGLYEDLQTVRLEPAKHLVASRGGAKKEKYSFVHTLRRMVVCVKDVVKALCALPVAGTPTLTETFSYLADFVQMQALFGPLIGNYIHPLSGHMDNIDDYGLASPMPEDAVRTICVSLVISVKSACEVSHERAFRQASLVLEGNHSLPLPTSPRGRLLHLLKRATIYDSSLSLTKSRDARNAPVAMYYSPDPNPPKELGIAGLLCRMMLEDRSQLDLLARDITLPEEPFEGELARGVGRKIVDSAGKQYPLASAFDYVEGGWYYKDDSGEWKHMDLHPTVAKNGLRVRFCSNIDSFFDAHDDENHDEFWPMFENGSGVITCDIAAIDTIQGAIYIARRPKGILFNSANKRYLLSPRFVDFNTRQDRGYDRQHGEERSDWHVEPSRIDDLGVRFERAGCHLVQNLGLQQAAAVVHSPNDRFLSARAAAPAHHTVGSPRHRQDIHVVGEHSGLAVVRPTYSYFGRRLLEACD